MKIFNNLKYTVLVFFIVFSHVVFAANPSSPFLPSDNVQDPNCTPLDSNCYVLLTSFQNETVTGLDYATSTGVLSLTSGYNIPLTASTTAWNSAIGALGGSALLQNGNSFGTTLTLGTNDTQALSFKTNGINRFTIDTSGNITATGTITATSFFGNGSNLSGIFSTSTTRGVFSASGPLVYATSTGNFLITQASSTSNGYLSSADFTTFQAKENAITASTTSTYFRGDKTFRTLDTSVVPENGNLYFTNARVNSLLSATTSLPNITTLSGLVSATSLGALGTITTGVWNATPIGDAYLTKTGDWAGTFNSRTGSYYLDRANHTGTQLASTILDFGTTTRNLLSSSATGLSYSSSTGVLSLTSGYSIPTTASTTVWDNKVSSQWTTSGANVFYTAGNVGIGTSSPSSLLSLYKAAANTYLTIDADASQQSGVDFRKAGISKWVQSVSSGSNDLSFFNGSTNVLTVASSGGINVSGGVAGSGLFSSTGNTGGYSVNRRDNNANAWILYSAAGDLQFYDSTNSSDKFVIKSGGNVGIGTTTPAYILDVNGIARMQSALYVGTTTGTEGGNDNIIRTTSNSAFLNLKGGSGLSKITIGNAKINIINGNTGDTNFAFGATSDTSNGTTGMSFSRTGGLVLGNAYIATDPGAGNMIISGNVGMGTTSPTAKLAVTGTAGTGNVLVIASSTNASLFTVSANGNVGIGAGTPATQLTLFGNGSNTQEIKFSNPGSWFGSIGMASGQNLLITNNTNGGAMTDAAIKGIAISPLGNVGIGTTTPGAALHVNTTGSTMAIFQSTTAQAPSIRLQGTDRSVTLSAQVNTLDVTGAYRTSLDGSDSTNNSFLMVNANSAITYGSLGVNSSSDIVLNQASTTRNILLVGGNVGIGTTSPMARLSITGTAGSADIFSIASSTNANILTVAANGNVGIGTTNPGTKLSVNSVGVAWDGTMYPAAYFLANGTNGVKIGTGGNGSGEIVLGASNPLTINAVNGISSTGFVNYTAFGSIFNSSLVNSIALKAKGFSAGQTADIFQVANSADTLLLNVTAAGNLGLGSTTPTKILSMGAGNDYANFDVRTNTANLSLNTTGNGTTQLNLTKGTGLGTGYLKFFYGATNAGTIGLDGANNFGIYGANSATTTLSAGNSGNLYLNGGASGYITLNANNIEAMRINSSGNVAIGTTTPADRLQVIGDIRVGTTGTNGCIKDFGGTGITGVCSSDERLKTNIVDLSEGYLDKMAKLRVISYNWNDTAKDLNKVNTANTNYGLLAQNVEENFPELVTTDSNGYKQVNYSRIPLYLIKSIQELSKKVDMMFAWFKNDALHIQNNVCVDDVCVTKEQFKQMLINGGNTQTNHVNTPVNNIPVVADIPVVSDVKPIPEKVVEPAPEVIKEEVIAPLEIAEEAVVSTSTE